VNAGNASAMAVAASCLRDIANFTGTPEYVCVATKQNKMGPFSSEVDLEAFAAKCK
jgi:hypothetical protein